MTTAAEVPITRDEALEGDEAWETLRQTGRRRLALDAIDRFRAADGFSHSRALAFQATLTLLPGIIAVVGLAAVLDVDSFTKAVREGLRDIAPGAVGDILTDALRQGTRAARQHSGGWALAGGGLAAAISGTTAMAQIERGANRIYGTETDRPFLRKYVNAALLAATAGTLALVSGGLLVAADDVGTAIRAVLWLAFMGAFALYIDATGTFGATYGPIAGTIGVLLWTFLSATALFLGLAVAAQLESVRAGAPEPRRTDQLGGS